MTFLPLGSTIPSSGNSGYYKFEMGENRFRIVGSAIVGWELWVSGKPLRRRQCQFTNEELLNADMNSFTGKRKIPTFFWAFPVFDYRLNTVSILELTQKTIMRGIESYLTDVDYGEDPKMYDLVITKDKSTDKTEYFVKAKPPKELEETIKEIVQKALVDINVEQLYDGFAIEDQSFNEIS